MTKILITGISGFMGSHLAEHLVNHGYEVYGISRYYNPYSPLFLKRINKKVSLAYGDITDSYFVKSIICEVKPDVVIHLAAQPDVTKSYKDPVGTFKTNIEGTYNVLEASKDCVVKYTIHQSSDKVYGSRENAKEDDPFMPVDPYSISKAGADRIAQGYMDKLNLAIVRPCNVYGFDLNLNRIIPYCITQYMKGERPIIRNRGAVRQFLYVKDYVSAIELLIEKQETGIFNLGSNDIVRIGWLAEEIGRNFNFEPIYTSSKLPEASIQSVDWAKIRKLGFIPKYILEVGLRETIEEYRRWFK